MLKVNPGMLTELGNTLTAVVEAVKARKPDAPVHGPVINLAGSDTARACCDIPPIPRCTSTRSLSTSVPWHPAQGAVLKISTARAGLRRGSPKYPQQRPVGGLTQRSGKECVVLRDRSDGDPHPITGERAHQHARGRTLLGERCSTLAQW